MAVRALMLLQLRQLLRAGIQSGRPSVGLRGQGRQVAQLLIVLFIGWQVYRFCAGWVADHSSLTRPAIALLLQPALTALGSSATIIIFFYAFNSLIGTFVEGRDLRLLLLAPISPAVVLGERILITSLGFSAVLLVAAPALFALGGDFTGWYYAAVVAGVVVLPIPPTSLAALGLLGLLRWLPPARARTISMFIGVALGLVFFLGSRFATSRGMQALPSLPPWLPTTWPARFIAATGLGDGRTALTYGGLSLALAAVLFGLATIVSARVLSTGAGSYAEVRRRASRAAEGRTARGAFATTSKRPSWWPIFVKDWLSLRRDPQRLILLLYPLAIIGFNAYQLLSSSRTAHLAVATGTTLSLLIVASLILVSTTAPGLVNWEGRAIVLLALAPVSPAGIVLSKWIVAVIPPLAVVEAALIGLALYLQLPAGEVALLALTLALLIAALAGMTLAINITWPKLDATNPRRPSSLTAGIASFVSDAVLCACVGVLLVLGLFVWHGAQAALAIWGALIAPGAVVAAVARLAPRQLQHLLQSGRLLGDSP